MTEYLGKLNTKYMNPDERQAYDSWKNQRRKCNNKNHKDYQWYGAKGVRVLYSSRDFIEWWTKNLLKKRWHMPTVGRIDHDRDYCFENIEMQERSENSRERVSRLALPIMKKSVIINFNGEDAVITESVKEASSFCKVSYELVSRMLHGKYFSSTGKQLNKTRRGISFRLVSP